MRIWMLAASAAALAIGGPALADKGGHGGGHGGGNGGGHGGGHGGGQEARGGGHGPQMKIESRGNGRVEMRAGRGDRHVEIERHRGNGREGRVDIARGSDALRDVERVVVRDMGDAGRRWVRASRYVDGCPPGLAKKDNGCLPPGQAMKLVGAPLAANFANAMVPVQYRSWYRDDDNYLYRYGDDYIYRVNRSNSLVDGLIPLFGDGYYNVGEMWPQPYNFYNVPYQYRTYYPDGGDYFYRYGDGAIYSVDPKTNLVNSIVALVAGDLGVGSRLPVGYDVYNVPYAYRDRYYDTSDAWYRYNDGYIYRVDPTTRLITAVIDAIT